MKSFDTELKKHADKIRLKATERRELRERVLSYMEYHPLPKQASTHKELQSAIKSESFVMIGIHSRVVQIVAAAFVLIMVVIPFAAERAVPGDVLYIIKTNVNEQIQGTLASSPYEKIEFETKLMERRIAEARVLASEGKLTNDVKTKIAENVKEHSTAVQTGLDELRNQDADGAAIAQIAFNSSLEVQSAVLADTETDEEEATDPILTVVKEAQVVAAKGQGSSTPSYGGLMARIELETTRAYELFETVKESATDEEITNIERRFADINRVIEEAQETREVDEAQSVAELAKVLGQVKKLIFFMADIDIRENVPLETLVPVVFSDDERIAIITAELEVINEMEADIERISEALEADEEEVPAKIPIGLEEIDLLIRELQTALDLNDIDAAETASKSARELAGDLLSILKPSAQEIELDPIVGTSTPEIEGETGTSTGTSTSETEESGEEENTGEGEEEAGEETPEPETQTEVTQDNATPEDAEAGENAPQESESPEV